MTSTLLIVGVGGFLGAVLRYSLSSLVQRLVGAGFPAGTLVVNVLGCLGIGYALGLASRADLSESLRLFVVVGLIGSFTTFSTLGYETVELLRAGSHRAALLSVGMQLALGLGAVVLGRMLVGPG